MIEQFEDEKKKRIRLALDKFKPKSNKWIKKQTSMKEQKERKLRKRQSSWLTRDGAANVALNEQLKNEIGEAEASLE